MPKEDKDSPRRALHLTGLQKLGLAAEALATFSAPFREGMYQEDRLRRLGDKVKDEWQDSVIKVDRAGCQHSARRTSPCPATPARRARRARGRHSDNRARIAGTLRPRIKLLSACADCHAALAAWWTIVHRLSLTFGSMPRTSRANISASPMACRADSLDETSGNRAPPTASSFSASASPSNGRLPWRALGKSTTQCPSRESPAQWCRSTNSRAT